MNTTNLKQLIKTYLLIIIHEKYSLFRKPKHKLKLVCADGIYFYIVEFEVNSNKKTLKGNVTLIR